MTLNRSLRTGKCTEALYTRAINVAQHPMPGIRSITNGPRPFIIYVLCSGTSLFSRKLNITKLHLDIPSRWTPRSRFHSSRGRSGTHTSLNYCYVNHLSQIWRGLTFVNLRKKWSDWTLTSRGVVSRTKPKGDFECALWNPARTDFNRIRKLVCANCANRKTCSSPALVTNSSCLQANWRKQVYVGVKERLMVC